jgi:iron complex transport system substrate-binding protein
MLTALLTAGFQASTVAKPSRIVSINVCTDQMALLMAPRAHIQSLSHLVVRPDLSLFTELAAGIPLNHGNVEEIVSFSPDIVLASSHGSQPAILTLRRLGYDVTVLGLARSMDDVRQRLRSVGEALGTPAEAEALVEDLDARLAAVQLQSEEARPTAIYYTPGGYTAGDATLIGDIITHAGLTNLAVGVGIRGYGRIQLETILVLKPDILVFDDRKPEQPALAYEMLRHPAFKSLVERSRVVVVPTRLLICGLPFNVEAVEQLAEIREEINRSDGAMK